MMLIEAMPTSNEIILGLEASSQILRLPDAILTPEVLATKIPEYDAYTLLAPHVWIHPGLANCLAQTEKNEFPEFFIESGGIASGKTVLVKQTGRLRVRTATTRPPRPGETNGVDYDFITSDPAGETKPNDVFLKLAREGFFAETVHLGEYFYGTPWTNIDEAMNTPGAPCVLCVVEQEGIKNLQPQIYAKYGKNPLRITIIPELTPRQYLAQLVGSRIKKSDDILQIFWRLSLTYNNMLQAPRQTDIFIGNSFEPGGLEESTAAINFAIQYCLTAIKDHNGQAGD